MIRELRSRHRLMIALLAVVAPGILVLALSGRGSMPITRLPTEFTPGRNSDLLPIGAEWTLLMNPPIRARYLAAPGDSVPAAVLLIPDGPATQPDLLLYWAATAGDSTQLPPQAILLGSLQAEEPLRLPPRDSNRGGYLILYSLAHDERVGTAKLPPVLVGASSGP